MKVKEVIILDDASEDLEAGKLFMMNENMESVIISSIAYYQT